MIAGVKRNIRILFIKKPNEALAVASAVDSIIIPLIEIEIKTIQTKRTAFQFLNFPWQNSPKVQHNPIIRQSLKNIQKADN